MFAVLSITSCSPEFQAELDQILIDARRTYYISPSGNDSNTGNSPEDAFKTIEKLNSMEFEPGSKILFEGGKTFNGQLVLTAEDANDAEYPVLISSYGSGKATIASGDKMGISVYNTAGIVIDRLIITGSGMNINQTIGINFHNDLPGNIKLDKIEITNCEVSGYKKYGILISAKNINSGFNNVLIENTKVHDILDTGISSTGDFSATKTGYAHSNFIVRNCEVFNVPGYSRGQHSGNGIVLSDVQFSTIEYSTVYNCGKGNTHCGGPVGIWYWDADNVTIQHNEAYNISSGSGCDGGGFDLDGGVTNGVMQYNYSHDNDGAGYLVGQFSGARPMNNIIVRYNISQNDGATNGGSLYLFNGSTQMDNIYVYNNTFYISEQGFTQSAAIKFLDWRPINGNINIINNILYTANGADLVSVPKGHSANFTGNLYYDANKFNIQYQGNNYTSLEAFRASGKELSNNLPTGLQGDPLLINPGTGSIVGFGNSLGSLNAYQLKNESPAKDKGIKISSSIGNYDYFGNTPLQGLSQDIGAHELQ
jgi:hypothetical protein